MALTYDGAKVMNTQWKPHLEFSMETFSPATHVWYGLFCDGGQEPQGPLSQWP